MTEVIPSYTQGVFTKTNLHFQDVYGEWIPLPEWGSFLINLGGWVAQAQTKKNRLVLGLAIPIRNYAAALAALGVVLARVDIPIRSIDINRHFQQFSSLPIGTAVHYKYGTKKLKGIYQGVEEVYGEQRLRIQIQNRRNGGGLTNIIRKEESLNVKIASNQNTKLPKRQNGRYILNNKDFIEAVTGKKNLQYFINNYYTNYSIIGRFNLLKQEIMEAQFRRYLSKYKFKEGNLQDILRVGDFFTTEGQPYCGEVLSAQGNTLPQTTDELVPHVVIFDGTTGFIKWRDYYRNSHWIVLLERTDLRFQEAVDILNQEYINRVDEEVPNILSPLSSFEMIVYQQQAY
ncbi:MAG: hypothetical protein WBA41_12555 [Rivularia sp. (in: cyanobacteria)]